MLTLEKTSEELNEQTSANTTDNKGFLYEAIENTPFSLCYNEGKWFGLLSNKRLTEFYDNKEECIKDVTNMTWDRIVQVIWVISEKMIEIKNLNLTENEQ